MQITQIKQIGKSENYRIFLNDNFAIVLNGQTIIKNNLKEGIEIDKQTLEQMQFESEKILAFDKAANLLGKSAKTQKQITDYLKQKGYAPQICTYVVEKLKDYGYINDLEYAKMYVEKTKGQKGANWIKSSLIAKGIDMVSIQKALENLNQEHEIDVLCAKYMKNKPATQDTKQKLYRHLISKGFTYGQANRAVNKIFNQGEEDDWY
jgi:regulatory protein